MGYWIPVGEGNRVFKRNLSEAFEWAAIVLYGKYQFTNGNIHRSIPEYHPSTGIPIYDTRTGKKASHYVRFDNGSNPKDGYQECTYSDLGLSYKSKSFPKNW